MSQPSPLRVLEALTSFCLREYGKLRPLEAKRIALVMQETAGGSYAPDEIKQLGATTKPWRALVPELTDDERRLCHATALVLAAGTGQRPIPDDLRARIEELFGGGTSSPHLDVWLTYRRNNPRWREHGLGPPPVHLRIPLDPQPPGAR